MMSKSAQAQLNYLRGEPRELAIRFWIALNYGPNSMSAVWNIIARREAEKAVDSGWRS
jgi:hypothetical protein